MTLSEIAVAIALGAGILLGLTVVRTNARRTVNIVYGILSLVITGWLACNLLTLRALDSDRSVALIRAASALAALIPTVCHLLRMSVRSPGQSLARILRQAWGFLPLAVATTVISFHPAMVRTVHFLGMEKVAEPNYGPLFSVYVLYFVVQVVSLFVTANRDRRVLLDAQKSELDYVILGSAGALVVGTGLGLVMTMVTGTSQMVPLVNAISIMMLSSIIAYGIVTRRLMGVAEVVQTLLSYALVAGYLCFVYFLIFLTLRLVGRMFGADWTILAGLVATLTVAFSLTHASARVQPYVSRLVFGESALRRDRLLHESGRRLMSVQSVTGLHREFVNLLDELVDVKSVTIMGREGRQYRERFPAAGEATALVLSDTEPLVEWLVRSGDPLPRYAVERGRDRIGRDDILRWMNDGRIHLAVPVFGAGGIDSMVLLGPRQGGHMFGRRELDDVRSVCEQFGFALANAQLYTAVEDAKLYNEILLENLSSGVIACDAERRITLLNREASRILKAPAAALAGRGIDALPPGLAEPMEQTLTAGRGVHDAELVLSDGEVTHLRLSSSVITGLEGRRLGALVVLNDVTMLRRMEDRMRRADRLASVGTLAAGMAHEIKNPLVSIKTFVQVLPRAFDDPEVRSTFCPLIESEVSRIDTVVNHLLNFARPAKASLEPTHLHAVLVHTLRLVEPRLRSKGITLETVFDAPADLIEGDASLLEQVFINLYFNAVDAMSSGGRLRVETSVAQVETGDRDLWGAPVRVRRLRVSVRDTGHGIRAADLAHVFDPFFTTKSEGSGLGLAIAYGIIQEHRGSFDVESRVGEGTSFHVAFPLATEGGGL
jgi:PAS domain S-box-containing protein